MLTISSSKTNISIVCWCCKGKIIISINSEENIKIHFIFMWLFKKATPTGGGLFYKFELINAMRTRRERIPHLSSFSTCCIPAIHQTRNCTGNGSSNKTIKPTNCHTQRTHTKQAAVITTMRSTNSTSQCCSCRTKQEGRCNGLCWVR